MGSKTMKDFGLSGRGFQARASCVIYSARLMLFAASRSKQIYSVTTDSKVLAAIFKREFVVVVLSLCESHAK